MNFKPDVQLWPDISVADPDPGLSNTMDPGLHPDMDSVYVVFKNVGSGENAPESTKLPDITEYLIIRFFRYIQQY